MTVWNVLKKISGHVWGCPDTCMTSTIYVGNVRYVSRQPDTCNDFCEQCIKLTDMYPDNQIHATICMNNETKWRIYVWLGRYISSKRNTCRENTSCVSICNAWPCFGHVSRHIGEAYAHKNRLRINAPKYGWAHNDPMWRIHSVSTEHKIRNCACVRKTRHTSVRTRT